jgi:hypothetical protein
MKHAITTLWPGLTQLWLRGSALGLVTAIGFAATLNLALVVSFVYPELAGPHFPVWLAPCAVWFLVLWLWVAGWRKSCQLLAEWYPRQQPADAATEALFCQAQAEYLKGHWRQAEELLSQLLARRSRDVEGRLLLASIRQRMGQWDRARQLLDELSQDDAAVRWQFEIARERELLAAREQDGDREADADVVPLPASAAKAA